MSPVQTRARRVATERVRARLSGLLGGGVDSTGGLDHLPWEDDVIESAGSVPVQVPTSSAGSLLPPAVRGGRFALDARGTAALATVAACAVLLAAWFAWRSSSTTMPLAPTVRTAGVPVATASGPGAAVPSAHGGMTSTTVLVVDVAGRVRRPGLVRLPVGARVADALAAAGGVLPGVDLTMLNLAQPLADGQQVVVPVGGASAGAARGGGAGAPGGGAAAGALVDLNTAGVEQLDSLPGVGPVLARRIVDYRIQHGRFSSIDELGQVGGIGAKKLADIAPKVRV